MQESEYRNLINHMEWADAQIWTTILSLPSLENDVWIKERLYHCHSTQWAYGQILLKLPLLVPELNSFPDIRSIGLWARQFYKEMSMKLLGLNETELQQNVEFPWSAQVAKQRGAISYATVGESIIQLALHTTHHRGQVAMYLRKAGGEPPITDFIAWIWMRYPAPKWGILSAT